MLNEACRLLGVDTEYYDIWGNRHETTDDTKRAVLASLGVDPTNDDTLRRSLDERKHRLEGLIDKTQVLPLGAGPLIIPVRPPHGAQEGTLQLRIVLEGGEERTSEVRLGELGYGQIPGDRLLTLPDNLPLGYHELHVTLNTSGQAAVEAKQRLILTPRRAWLPEKLEKGEGTAGLAVSLYGLRTERNWGTGDFHDLQRLACWAAREMGVAFIALNPLHILHNREPYNTSPYLPLSSYYRNYIYLDIEGLPEFQENAKAKKLLSSQCYQKKLAALRATEFVDYNNVAELKRGFLRLLFRSFLREWRKETPRVKEFKAYAGREGGLLRRFATYCALDEVLHQRDRDLWTWPQWPAEYQDPNSEAVKTFAETYWRRVLFYQWVQWLIDRQLAQVQKAAREAGMLIGLYHDVALATDRCGADLWAYREFFVEGCRVGSPPDDFAPEGQDWAFPPPNPDVHEADGYHLFAESVRKNARHGGALRIDHVMRFFRLFWIPDQAIAKNGTYVHDKASDLMHILALESHRGQFLVVGEDLGTCPPEIRDALRDYGILSYKLFYFEKRQDGSPKRPGEYERQALVSSTTHDLPTLAGFWAARDLEVRRSIGMMPDDAWFERQKHERREEKHRMLEALIEAGFLPQDFSREAADSGELSSELHSAILGYLSSSKSILMLLNQEDLTKETEQQNMPGTTHQYPNWKRKMRLSLDELEGQDCRGFITMFHGWLEKTNRL